MKVRLMHPKVGQFAFPLRAGASLIIGRLGSMTDVAISWDPRISRRHCRIWEQDGRVWFQDLESRNGSWVGNERVSGVVRLAPGSSVLMGETVLILPDVHQSDGEVETTHERPLSESEAAWLIEHDQAPPHDWSKGEFPQTAASRSDSGRPALPPRSPTLPNRDLDSTIPPKELTTADLRNSSDIPSPNSEPKAVRTAPRFVSPTKVQVRALGREDLRELWMRDISKGGLFVETSTAPPPGTALQVVLQTPAGMASLKGTVVHVLTEETAASFGGKPGVGIQFIDLDPKTRKAIQSYVEGVAERLTCDSQDLPRITTDVGDSLVQSARRFLYEAENSDFYHALEIPPNAKPEQIRQTVKELEKRWQSSLEGLKPPQAARLNSALNVLGRVGRILSHTEGRLEYDFRHGHVRARERIELAQTNRGPGLAALRRTWNHVYPDRIDRAALLTRKAFAAKQQHDLVSAIAAGKAALDLNPFFEELRQTLEVWDSKLEGAEAS